MKTSDCAVCALPALVLSEVRGLGRRRAVARLTELGYGIGESTVRYHLKQHTSPAERLLGLTALPVVAPPSAPDVPKGWEVGIKWAAGAKAATITLPPSPTPHTLTDAEAELKRMGYDLADWLVEPKELRHDPAAWYRDAQGEDAVTRDTWRAIFTVRARTAFDAVRDDADLDDLRAWIGEMDSVTLAEPTVLDETLVVGLADWQAGKRDGDGLQGLMRRLVELPALIEARFHELTRLGRRISQILLMGLGDLIEGCTGFYPDQQFTVELYGRQQRRVARRALAAIVKRLARLGVRILVSGVPGNHGENRTEGNKSGTPKAGDNFDLEVLEVVAEQFEDVRGYEHVSFVVPEDRPYLELELTGRTVVFQHGHYGQQGWKGIWSWFKNQRAHANVSATVLVCGHYHHLHMEQDGILTMVQVSALEGESTWVKDGMGPATVPGTTTFLVSGHSGVRDLLVLAA